MSYKIAILGSTGSIGKSLIDVLKFNKKKIKINLLTTNTNYKELFKQANYFSVKHLIITDVKIFNLVKSFKKYSKFKIYNNFDNFNKIFITKNDYVMSSIVGLPGLIPTIKIIKYTKKIAIANKESLICAWNIINKELKKYNTLFSPVDSEHASIWFDIRNHSHENISKIYLTASGGPLLNISKKNIDSMKISKILSHPNWSMGKKISTDSATMMNKVFEIIEARNIFNLSYQKLSILIHPNSYIHAIIKFKNGFNKIIFHETDMKIPICNTLDIKNNQYIKEITNKKNIQFSNLNNLNLSNINISQFPVVKILNKIPKKLTLFETVIVSANDELVSLFLNRSIKFTDISKNMIKIVDNINFTKYKKMYPSNIKKIYEVNNLVKNFINLKFRNNV